MTPREEVEKALKMRNERGSGNWVRTEGYEFGRYYHFDIYEKLGTPTIPIPEIFEAFLLGHEDNLNGAWLTWKLNGGSDGRHPADFEKRV